jgi:hypothetical protein
MVEAIQKNRGWEPARAVAVAEHSGARTGSRAGGRCGRRCWSRALFWGESCGCRTRPVRACGPPSEQRIGCEESPPSQFQTTTHNRIGLNGCVTPPIRAGQGERDDAPPQVDDAGVFPVRLLERPAGWIRLSSAARQVP